MVDSSLIKSISTERIVLQGGIAMNNEELRKEIERFHQFRQQLRLHFM